MSLSEGTQYHGGLVWFFFIFYLLPFDFSFVLHSDVGRIAVCTFLSYSFGYNILFYYKNECDSYPPIYFHPLYLRYMLGEFIYGVYFW
jgi:hypothetical protein